MSTYFKLHYHIVFGTKNRIACLDRSWRAQLWEYMGGTVRGLGGVPHGVGGWNDHVHLLIDLKPTSMIPDVVRELKKASTDWVREHAALKTFQWQEGYGVFTVGWRERDVVKQYIAKQGGAPWEKGVPRGDDRIVERGGRGIRSEISAMRNTGCDPAVRRVVRHCVVSD